MEEDWDREDEGSDDDDGGDDEDGADMFAVTVESDDVYVLLMLIR